MDNPRVWTFRWLDARLLWLALPVGVLGAELYSQRLDYANWPAIFGFPFPAMRWLAGASGEYVFSPAALAADLATYTAVAYLVLAGAIQFLQRRHRINRRWILFVPIALFAAAVACRETVGTVLPIAIGAFHPTSESWTLEPPPAQRHLLGRRMGWYVDLRPKNAYSVNPEDAAEWRRGVEAPL